MIPKKIKTNRNEYDEVMSLGGSCSAATQVQHRGKRKHSFPLEWMYKLWMWAGRYLERHNAGCANMRFMSWSPTDY